MKALERYQNVSKERKKEKKQYLCEWHKNLSENEKQKLVEYRKQSIMEWEKCFIIIIRKYFNLGNFASL